jgi:flagellar basal-body rod modification protein FlgD
MVTSVDSKSLLYNVPPSDRVPSKTLGQNDFVKLLITQLANQNPLKPTDGNEMLSQMAQITSVQTMTAMQDSMGKMRTDQQMTLGQGLINKRVEVMDPATGASVVGIVDRVHLNKNEVSIEVNGAKYPINTLQGVLKQTETNGTTP